MTKCILKLLLSVGEDNHHVFNVWKWKTGKIVASARGHSDKVSLPMFMTFEHT